MSTVSSPRGAGSVPGSTWRPSRSSAGCPGWPDASARHQLDGWEFDVLSALRRAGTPYELSPGQLVTETLVTSGTMTNRVDRLAARGYVERHPDPSDRRGVLVRLTPTGMDVVDAALADLLAHEHQLLAELSGTERDDLAALLRRLLHPFETDAG